MKNRIINIACMKKEISMHENEMFFPEIFKDENAMHDIVIIIIIII